MFKQLKPRRRLTVRTLLSVFLQCAEWHRSAGRAGDLNAPSPFFLPFLFFDTRRQICSKSLSQFEALTLQSHTHAHTPKKAHTPQLHRWWCGGWGGDTHRYQMRFVSKRAPMAVWGVCVLRWEVRTALWILGNLTYFFFCCASFYLSGSRLRSLGGK